MENTAEALHFLCAEEQFGIVELIKLRVTNCRLVTGFSGDASTQRQRSTASHSQQLSEHHEVFLLFSPE